MNKLSKLLQLVESFYKKAMVALAAEPMQWHMPDDLEEENESELTGNIPFDADKFDIKDEKLFNQFETFMSAYYDVANSLQVSAESLSPENIKENGELLRTLENRYERLIENPYLDSNAFIENEDFPPDLFTSFIQNVISDIQNKINLLETQDISVQELMQAGVPEEFNTEIDLAGNQAAEKWSADKISKMLGYRKEWFSNLQEAKKFGKNHPKWEQYQKYIATRKANYHKRIAEIKANPEEYREYKKRLSERVDKRFKNRTEEIRKLLLVYNSNTAKIGLLPQGYEKNKLLDENVQIKAKLLQLSKHLAKTEESSFHVAREKEIQKRKDIKESDTLKGANLIFKQKTQTAKSEVKKRLLKTIDSHPSMIEVRKKIEAAFIDYKREPTPEKRAYLEILQKTDKQLKDDLTNMNPIFIKTTSEIDELESFRKMVDQVVQNSEDAVPPNNLLGMGEELIKKYSKEYKSVMNALNDVLNKLRTL